MNASESASHAAQNENEQNRAPHAAPLTILGAGPAGALMSILLARRGHAVTVYERLPDLRRTSGIQGRSINLALADRGIHALKRADVMSTIERLLVPMRGRMLHDETGKQTLVAYGARADEVIYSISRSSLTAALIDSAERTRRVEFRFRHNCMSVDTSKHALCIQDIPSGKLSNVALERVIGADGAGSILRRYLVENGGADCAEQMLAHGYKELEIKPDADGNFALDPHALHIWPRGEFMLIALPNTDRTFTATLFLPLDGPVSFAALTTPAAVHDLFAAKFPDALALLPTLADQFFAHPTGSLGTVRLDRWTDGDAALLIGDAAHAIVPFHGQGMNCAFEDCIVLDELLEASTDWRAACTEFQRRRQDDCTAIADMALENYVEMRDTVRHAKFQLQKELSLELERRFPDRFVPRYSMVMFHHEIPYSVAQTRGRIQQKIVEELTRNASALTDIDFAVAQELITQQLEPLSQRTRGP